MTKPLLTFDLLRHANVQRLPTFKNTQGVVIHNADGSDWTPSDWLEALIGELGEYANKRKKFRRGELSNDEFYQEASKELADVQIYLDILAFRLGIDLGAATLAKFNEVSLRVGSPIFIVNRLHNLWVYDNSEDDPNEPHCLNGK